MGAALALQRPGHCAEDSVALFKTAHFIFPGLEKLGQSFPPLSPWLRMPPASSFPYGAWQDLLSLHPAGSREGSRKSCAPLPSAVTAQAHEARDSPSSKKYCRLQADKIIQRADFEWDSWSVISYTFFDNHQELKWLYPK